MLNPHTYFTAPNLGWGRKKWTNMKKISTGGTEKCHFRKKASIHWIPLLFIFLWLAEEKPKL